MVQRGVGIDVSLEWSRVCTVDTTGLIVREAKAVSKPEALVRFFGQPGVRWSGSG